MIRPIAGQQLVGNNMKKYLLLASLALSAIIPTAAAIIFFPVVTLPVKTTLLTLALTRFEPVSPNQVTTLKTPSGKPILLKIFAISLMVNDLSLSVMPV